MSSSLEFLDIPVDQDGATSGLVRVSDENRPSLRLDEEVALRDAGEIFGIEYVFFRRFSGDRSSQVAAYVIDNEDERFNETELAKIHKNVWLNGNAPLLYISWLTRVDILSCARGPDFWQDGHQEYCYHPAGSVEVNSASLADIIASGEEISEALQNRQRFSFRQLSDGTFWDNPNNSELAQADQGAHQRLIKAVIEADEKLNGEQRPELRQLLLLTILIKYLEDRGVFAESENWFDQFHSGSETFFDVLQNGTPAGLYSLLSTLEKKFQGDVFCLPLSSVANLTDSDLKGVLSTFVEAKTLRGQRYLWDAYSFRYLPVEVLSHLYQHFAHHNQGAIYTPPFVATLILDFALPYSQINGNERILDPTCGSGFF